MTTKIMFNDRIVIAVAFPMFLDINTVAMSTTVVVTSRLTFLIILIVAVLLLHNPNSG